MEEEPDIHDVCAQLQELVGEKPEITVSDFNNWANTQERNEILSVCPTTVEEVRAVVGAVKTYNEGEGIRKPPLRPLRVRAAGAKHFWTPLFSDEGDIVMHVQKIKRPDAVEQIELTVDPDDPESNWVTMATGTTVRDFMAFQLDNNVCIPANVLVRAVQMGGVVAPACHGTGWDMKTVSDELVGMRIIDSNGVLRTYSLKKDKDMMRAVQANLGLWGIIVDLTLKVSPMIIVETQECWEMKVKDIFYPDASNQKLRDIVTKNMTVEIFWFPFNSVTTKQTMRAYVDENIDWDPKEDKVWIRLVNKTDKTNVKRQHFYKGIDQICKWQAWFFKWVAPCLIKHPRYTPNFLRSQVKELKKLFSGTHVQEIVHAVHFRDYNEAVPVNATEWAISVNDDFSNIFKAIQHVIDCVQEEAKVSSYPMNLPLEMRFTQDSDVYMAPSGGSRLGASGHTCSIEVLTVAGTEGWGSFSQKVADLWQTIDGARPHWCKEWQDFEGIDEFLQKSYINDIPKYLEALERSGADPDGIFFNNRLEKILYPGPKGHPGRAKVNASRGKHGGDA